MVHRRWRGPAGHLLSVRAIRLALTDLQQQGEFLADAAHDLRIPETALRDDAHRIAALEGTVRLATRMGDLTDGTRPECLIQIPNLTHHFGQCRLPPRQDAGESCGTSPVIRGVGQAGRRSPGPARAVSRVSRTATPGRLGLARCGAGEEVRAEGRTPVFH